MTYESVAEALGLSLAVHEPTVARMKVSYAARGLEVNAARLRMATLPTPSEVPLKKTRSDVARRT